MVPTPTSTTPESTVTSADGHSQQLERLLHQRLRQSGRRQLFDITGSCQGDFCRLTGRVPTFFLKQLAQEIARKTDGIVRLENQIQVVDSWSADHGTKAS